MIYKRPSEATVEAIRTLVDAELTEAVATVAAALGVQSVTIDRIYNGFRARRYELRLIEAQL